MGEAVVESDADDERVRVEDRVCVMDVREGEGVKVYVGGRVRVRSGVTDGVRVWEVEWDDDVESVVVGVSEWESESEMEMERVAEGVNDTVTVPVAVWVGDGVGGGVSVTVADRDVAVGVCVSRGVYVRVMVVGRVGVCEGVKVTVGD